MTSPSYARLLLEHWGIKVEDIPTSDKEESDFLALFGDSRVLIEEKRKEDDPTYLVNRAESLALGKIYTTTVPVVRDNRLSGIVAKAAKQLQSSSDRDHNFRLVWFTGVGVNAEAKYHQFIASLYGTTNIIEMNSVSYRRCYFFRNSDFHRYANIIDGAVAAYVSGTSITAKLCLNPLSPNCESLRTSQVTAAFGTGVEDPEKLEADGTAFIVDGDIDRGNEGAVLGYLQQKYNTQPLMKIDLGQTTRTVAVDTER